MSSGDDEPWLATPPPHRESTEAELRYERAQRLSQFKQDVERGISVMMSEERLAYRRACLDRWQDYLDGWTPGAPRAGGRPKRRNP